MDQQLQLRTGDILVATVSLLDPNFQHTVILLCGHRDDEGSYGLILNRPIDLLRELTDVFPVVSGCLFAGGPVQREALQVLHPFGADLPGASEVVPGLWVGGDFEALREGIQDGVLEAARCRFFLGYAGWGRGQLAAEFSGNAWIQGRGSAEFVLETAAAQLWAAAIRRCGENESIYAHFPRDPTLN